MKFNIITLSKFKLLYVPIPKCACTTLKHLMYFLEFGEWYQRNIQQNKHIHQFYGYDNLVETLDNYDDWYKFAVVREPIDRFRSFYQNKIIQEKQYFETSIDINDLVFELAKHQDRDGAFKHHTETQKSFLGDNLNLFDRIYKIEDLSQLHTDLQEITDRKFSLPRKQVSNPHEKEKSSLSHEAIVQLINFYQEDYLLLKSFYQVPSII